MNNKTNNVKIMNLIIFQQKKKNYLKMIKKLKISNKIIQYIQSLKLIIFLHKLKNKNLLYLKIKKNKSKFLQGLINLLRKLQKKLILIIK